MCDKNIWIFRIMIDIDSGNIQPLWIRQRNGNGEYAHKSRIKHSSSPELMTEKYLTIKATNDIYKNIHCWKGVIQS